MNKSTHFTGQPILSQLLNLIPRSRVNKIAREHQSDRYCKRFMTYDHLVSMLFCVLGNCTSLREVSTGLMACGGKLNHLGGIAAPARSTLSDANKRRDFKVFESIYYDLYKRISTGLPDSRTKNDWFSKLYIVDSTTITLFQEILKAAGRSPMNGKRKGGIKVHTLIKANEDVPCFVRFSAAAAHDSPFLKEVSLPQGAIITMDRGYQNYSMYNQWTKKNISFITRLRAESVYAVEYTRQLSKEQRNQGVLSDQQICTSLNRVDRFLFS